MLPDRVSNPGPLTYESGALPIALRGPAPSINPINKMYCKYSYKNIPQVLYNQESHKMYWLYFLQIYSPYTFRSLLSSRDPLCLVTHYLILNLWKGNKVKMFINIVTKPPYITCILNLM